MKRPLVYLAVGAILAVSGAARASTTVSVDPINLSICGKVTNIGSISATTTDVGNANGDVEMEALFTLKEQSLLDCVTFHWVQIITHATTTLEFPKGTPVGMNVPIVDTPNGGYFFDPGSGYIRTPPGEDDLPWYWTLAEEKGAGKTNFNSDTISDGPTVTAATFKTWLVLQEGDSKTFCVLAGFTWTTGADGDETKLASLGAPNAAAIREINTALTNGDFAGWTAEKDCDINCCPEPGTLMSVVFAGALTVGGRAWRSRRRAA